MSSEDRVGGFVVDLLGVRESLSEITGYCWRTPTEITSAILKPDLWSFRSHLPCPLSMNQLRLFQPKRGVSL